MGLDVVEIVLRCQEVFAITLEDGKLRHTETLGQLFELICTELHLPNGTAAPTGFGINRLTRRFDLRGWTRQDAWATLAGIFCGQMCMEPDEITYAARIGADLGID